MNRRHFVLACTLILAMSATTSGCFKRYSACPGEGARPAGITGQDLPGTYRSPTGSVVLNSDGTFTSVGWPADLDGATGDPARRAGSGTWKLSAAGDSGWPVSFTFHEISGYWDSKVKHGYYGNGVYVSGTRDTPHFYEYVGDPDACHLNTFTRAE
ncbi:hypothetical protein AB0B78_14895 [Streptomyces sp. NPDC040724]|uniref:hypothetical protein n=1 Tax=unclassified Streptomyces TaxID=2593676 RepID=UPI003410B47F